MKVKIVALGKEDAWYPERKQIIGAIGTLENTWTTKGGFRTGDFTSDTPIHVYDTDFTWNRFCFCDVKVHQIK